ncbi:DUF4929 family protein [Aquimarina sp. TRL1]|uniref:DUF4929 family protein n=1 Tax=Aquimarina sp. (strain TRL1) TaxID=2736252 RepID=UPI00158AA00C|nr:DUF4929 family protein [Aquimarina sp. TRL1]QKX07404.1 DUF4929 family protein [Aquimarina sp. TRL1]
MKIIQSILYTLLGVMLITSCNSDDDGTAQFNGDVSVTLINKGNSSATEGEATDFIYDVILSKSFDSAVTLNFSLEDISGYSSLLAIDAPVIIKKNTTKGVLKITMPAKPDSENLLSEDKNFPIQLTSYSGIDNKITLSSNEAIAIKVEADFTPLTQEQKDLLEYYKTKGIDLTPWIGKIPVEVTVQTDGNGSFSPFDQATTKTYTGTTFITLSESATKEKPLLVMTNNAFGLSEYLQYVFRNETINNTGFWYAPNDDNVNPAAKEVLKAIGNQSETKWLNKEYSFNVIVDNLEFKEDNTIHFVQENGAHDIYTNFLDDQRVKGLSAVDFQYEFPLWDELEKLAKGNIDLTNHIISGGSLHPNNYIGYSTILEDDWYETNWVTPTSSYDNTDKVMQFTFNIDHANSGDYDIVKVTYTSPY